MIELLVLGAIAVAGLAVAAVLGFVLLFLRFVFWAVLLPVRLLFRLLMFPVWLALGAAGLVVGTVAVPVVLAGVALVAVLGVVAAVLAIVLPVIPFVLLGLLVWALVRRSPVAA